MKSKKENITNIYPTPGYVLLEPLEAQTKTSSGIYLPDNAKEKPTMGMVVEVGKSFDEEGKENKPPVNKGDKVFYKEWGGNKIKFEGKEYLFAKFEEILGVIK